MQVQLSNSSFGGGDIRNLNAANVSKTLTDTM